MKKFNGGEKVMIDASQDNLLDHRQYHGATATVDFQCSAICGVPGIVYVLLTLKGKRKPISLSFNQDALIAIN